MLALMVAGYLISTADGRPIDVFGLFNVPATLHDLPDQEDIAGVYPRNPRLDSDFTRRCSCASRIETSLYKPRLDPAKDARS